MRKRVFLSLSLAVFSDVPTVLQPAGSPLWIAVPRIGVRGFFGKFYSEIGRALPKGLRKSINFAAMEPKESPILQGLNPAQRDAVVNYDSPSLIIAGAVRAKRAC